MSYALVCLPTLELTTFEQQVCSTKISYTNALLLGAKKRNVNTLDRAYQVKKAVQLDSGWFEGQESGVHCFF